MDQSIKILLNDNARSRDEQYTLYIDGVYIMSAASIIELIKHCK